MRLCSVASGSSGNCIYAGTDTTHLLVDVGISGKRTEAGLNELGVSMRDIDGILVTHEHSDHIAGLGVLARKYGTPIYATNGTIRAIQNTPSVGKIPDELFHAAEPVAYRIQHGKKRIAIVTDLGTYNDYTIESLRGMDALVLEANHDIHMLQAGPYPYPLKQRILGDRGHLSNERAGQLLCSLIHDDLQAVVLGHLSKENNMPELAYEAVRIEVTLEQGKNMDFPMYVASRNEVSQVIHIA